jgi:DNA-binding Lrp family transcriptional regulator
LDFLDLKILETLRSNCRTPFSTIARNLGVSSTTVRNRVNKLKHNGILSSFVVELHRAAVDAKRVIILITTNQKEDRDFFSDTIGHHQLIESVALLNDGKYLVHATCFAFDDGTQIERFLSELPNVKSVIFDTLRVQSLRRPSFTKMQLKILSQLVANPRYPSSTVAEKIQRSTKGVRLAIKRLVNSDSIVFTTHNKFLGYFVIMSYENTYLTLEKIVEWIGKEFTCVWESLISSIAPTLYITFAVDGIDEINLIRDKICDSSFFSLQYASICTPSKFYGNKRHELLEYFIENGKLS